ncbi:MAG: right-handed parallel beta-helix repeat-containing protein [Candidatus Bathyarchaeota archaeon]|nr:right-handed parallel beta-helix repeat-containing protein [Candidatus Bathyarchaeota archaeon]MDH5732871.1 right-handed parallel beta-helix repeat-containing protein [Candidatus Bathyarchaeota archaeon]
MTTIVLGPILWGLNLTYNSKMSASTDVDYNVLSYVPHNSSPPHTPSMTPEPSTTLPTPATPITPNWTLIAVCPQTINLTASDSFTINVNVINVTDLEAYAFMLEYNATIVSVTRISLGGFFPKDSYVVEKKILTARLEGGKTSVISVAVCGPLGSHFKVNGNGTLATVRFKAISTGSCILKLHETMLVKDSSVRIPHNVVNGYVQCKIYEHEIASYFDAPVHLELGSSCMINGSAVNKGLSNETDVSFQLLVNGEVVNSTITSLLTAGSSIGLTYMFAPAEEKTYNVTAYVKPVPNEEHTQNNVISANVVVRTQIRVPQDFVSIQEAIDAAVSGETIIVASGVYHEHIGVDKPLTLTGESHNTTIIDGGGETRIIVVIKANEVRFSGFTIRNGGGGILLEYSNDSIIVDSIIAGTLDGLSLLFSHNNTVIANMMKDNERGLFLGDSNNNRVYYNNFINNTEQAGAMVSWNTLDNGVEGNYWSDYEGEDLNGDGIGDTPYMVDEDNQDNYPLMKERFS